MNYILSTIDIVSLMWLLGCWISYTLFALAKVKKSPAITSSLTQARNVWIERMLDRDMRISDTNALGILQRNVAFFASTSVFILAGLLTVLGSADKAIQLANTVPFAVENSREIFEIKILLLVCIFIYAFFKFSWSVRQYNFAVVIFGAAPEPESTQLEKTEFTLAANTLLTSANKSFNFGLRAFNFSMAIIAWFIQPWLFMIATTWVVFILYRREFQSNTLNALTHFVEK